MSTNKYQLKYYRKNRAKIIKRRRLAYRKNHERNLAYHRAYANRPEVIERRREKARQKAATPEGREKLRAAAEKHWKKHRKEILAKVRQRRRTDASFSKLERERRQRATEKLKCKIFSVLGWKCECCREAIREFLSVDHINGGGKEHRKSVGGSSYCMYTDIVRQGIPRDKFRTLCMNCNIAIGRYGKCPHQARMSVPI